MREGDGSEPLQSFARFIARKFGLHFPKERLPELAQKMASLGREAGFDDLECYLLQLMSAPLSQQQTEILAGALTIGETYFLRDPKSYRVLEETVFPEIIAARRRAGKSIKIWSAGCSSGEEPYSIAIILSRLLPDLAEWKITLLGTDINPQALERASLGVYSKWSFRNAPGWLMDYFTPRADGSFEIIPRIREMVRFSQLNLADDGERHSPLASGMDVIFCRNVMLYFHAVQIEKTVARFHAALKFGGWLFVGPTEVDHQRLRGFSCQYYEGALVLRKSEARQRQQRPPLPVLHHAPLGVPVPRAKESAPPTGEAPPPSGGRLGGGMEAQPALAGEAQSLYQAGEYEQAARAALASPELPENLALAARCYANLGRYAEAREQCEKALVLDRLNAHTHYLLSLILEQQGDGDGAVLSLRRALYLDHDYLLAYFAMGNLSRKRGEQREAEQSFTNALRLLQRHDPSEVLPQAEGMTAGMLAQLIKTMNHSMNQR